MRLRGAVRDICFLCHTNFLANATFIHAPVESGHCVMCHSPHQSTAKFPLKRKGQALCYECHDQAALTRLSAHAQIGATACQTCHNPHKGDKRFFLRTASPPPS